MQTASQVKATPSVTHATLAKLRPPAIHTPTVAAAEASTIDTQQENVTRLGHSFGSISIFPPDARSIQLKPVVASAPRLPAFSPPSQHRPNPIPVIPAGWAVSPRVQAKLTVGQPNNVYEQAADRVTEQVVQRLAKTDAEKEKLDRKEEHTETLPEWQKSHVSSVGADGGLQMKCAACEAEEERGHVQKKSNYTEGVASRPIESELNRSKGGGSPLSTATRTSMEAAMGADFSTVRVHIASNLWC